MTIRLIQTALLSFGLSALSSRAAAVVSNAPPLRATNVVAQRVVKDVIQISNTFAGFVPGSLAETIWAGFQTNGRTTRMWEFWQLPPGWPTNPPVLRWNTNNLMWGLKGMTAICQVWECMGAFGQVSITALTRRHGYVRGHSMGPSGLDPTRVGRRVWFCSRDNQVIERRMQLILIRAPDVRDQTDYSLILFDADLPPGIEPLRVADRDKVQRKYLIGDGSHKPIFMTLQGGFVNASLPGWTVPFGGGDSGAPVMLPLPANWYSMQDFLLPRPAPKCRPTWTCSAAAPAWTRAGIKCNGLTWTAIPTSDEARIDAPSALCHRSLVARYLRRFLPCAPGGFCRVG